MNVFSPIVPARSRQLGKSLSKKMKSPYLLEQKVCRALYLLGCPRPHVRNVCLGSRNTRKAGEYESTLEMFPSWVYSNLAKTGILLFLQGSFP